MALKPSPAAGLSVTASDLREAFDQGFSLPVADASAGVAVEDYLAIRVAGEAQLLSLSEVASLLPLRSVTRLPSPLPALLGIAGYRGSIVPVYDLGALLGYPPAVQAEAPPRWMVIAAAQPVGLAFETFEGHWRRTAEDRGEALAGAGSLQAPAPASAPAHAQPRAHEQEHAPAPAAADTLLTLDGLPRPLLSLAVLLARILDLAQALPAHKEQ